MMAMRMCEGGASAAAAAVKLTFENDSRCNETRTG